MICSWGHTKSEISVIWIISGLAPRNWRLGKLSWGGPRQAWVTTPAGLGIRICPGRGPRSKDHLRPNAGALSSHEDWESCARCPTHGEQIFASAPSEPLAGGALTRSSLICADPLDTIRYIRYFRYVRYTLDTLGKRYILPTGSPGTPGAFFHSPA